MTTLITSQLTEAREFISTATSRELKAAASQYGITARNPQTKQVWKSAELRSAILAVIDEQISAQAATPTPRFQRAMDMASAKTAGATISEIANQFGLSSFWAGRELAAVKLYQRIPQVREMIEAGTVSWQKLVAASYYSQKNSSEFFIQKLSA